MSRLRAHLLIVLGAAAAVVAAAQPDDARWLAGDTHLHSHWSPGYNRSKTPPEPIIGQDARYPTTLNAEMARRFGLSWMVTTDHGGPNHAKLNATRAYAELMDSRRIVPEVLQFYGMELNMPAMDHHTLIVPQTNDEWLTLYDIESRFDANEVFPVNPARRTEQAALAALEHIKALPRLPLLFANHPSRSAKAIRQYGQDEPRELRLRNDLAPEVYRGMEGAPGHQAGGLAPDGSQKRDLQGRPAGARGGYNNDGAHTLGGFDQMTAIVGGLWDSLLGEGRRFWIVASSDSHVHYSSSRWMQQRSRVSAEAGLPSTPLHNESLRPGKPRHYTCPGAAEALRHTRISNSFRRPRWATGAGAAAPRSTARSRRARIRSFSIWSTRPT